MASVHRDIAPAYGSELVTLYRADAADVVDILDRRAAQCIVTDPPYGVSWQSNMRKTKFATLAGDDGTLDVPGLLGMYTRRVLWTGQHVYVFGYSPDQLRSSLRLASTAELIWSKGSMSMGNLSLPWGTDFEKITFGVYADCDNPRTKRGGLSARLRRGSVISVPRVGATAIRHHPTEKPVLLLRQLIESSTSIGDTVLDPFAGTGSTLVAAVLEGRKAIGVEIDSDYVSVAVDRLQYAERIAEQANSV